jgi:hypothetical protein
MSCKNCTCADCVAASMRKLAKSAKEESAEALRFMAWLLWFTGLDVNEIRRLTGYKLVRNLIGQQDDKARRRASIAEGTELVLLERFERRLYEAKAIPIRDQRGDVHVGDKTYWERNYWDVDLPPDNWLSRHKERDPR